MFTFQVSAYQQYPSALQLAQVITGSVVIVTQYCDKLTNKGVNNTGVKHCLLTIKRGV